MTIHSSLRVLLEESRVPIYQRILEAFSSALKQAGCDVIWLKRSEHRNYNEVVHFLKSKSFDYCLVTNSSGLLSDYFGDIDRFLFEFIPSRLIFVHHDNLFSDYHTIKMIGKKIQALLRLNNRSIHFCIEPRNVKDLGSIGIVNVRSFFHASEYLSPLKLSGAHKSDVSFVGHVLPNAYQPMGDGATRKLLMTCFNSRIDAMDSNIEEFANEYSGLQEQNADAKIERMIHKYWFISAIHLASQHFRGEVIEKISDCNIDIIGGDPAYLAGINKKRKIQKKGVRNFPPLLDYKGTIPVYRGSKINLNITSLQFDGAVINRVIDVCACGGFILTDSKNELGKLTSLAQEISYRTVDELNTKIDYYLTHEQERVDIAAQMHDEISKKCTYDQVVNQMLDSVRVGTWG